MMDVGPLKLLKLCGLALPCPALCVPAVLGLILQAPALKGPQLLHHSPFLMCGPALCLS